MKYWWLEKYKNLKIIQMKELTSDVNYFLTMPTTYKKRYEIIKNMNIDNLDEEDLLILLFKIVNDKNIKDSSVNKIIKKLLLIPDNSFPPSDYSLEEMLEEVKKLKENKPYQDKLNYSNVAVCYNCLNVFYTDKIKQINKKNLCLCPYCLKSKLYFDSDYIPMNYSFINLAYLYYNTSKLGCTFKELKKLIKKSIIVQNDKLFRTDTDLTEIIHDKKIKPIEEKIISKKINDILLEKEHSMNYETTIYINKLNKDNILKILIILFTSTKVLSDSFYLKKVLIKLNNKTDYLLFKKIIKVIST